MLASKAFQLRRSKDAGTALAQTFQLFPIAHLPGTAIEPSLMGISSRVGAFGSPVLKKQFSQEAL